MNASNSKPNGGPGLPGSQQEMYTQRPDMRAEPAIQTCPDLGCQTCYPKRKRADERDERLLFRAYLLLIRDPRAPDIDYLLHDLRVRLGNDGISARPLYSIGAN